MTEAACLARYDTMVEETGSIMKWSSAIWLCVDFEVAMAKEVILKGLIKTGGEELIKYHWDDSSISRRDVEGWFYVGIRACARSIPVRYLGRLIWGWPVPNLD